MLFLSSLDVGVQLLTSERDFSEFGMGEVKSQPAQPRPIQCFA